MADDKANPQITIGVQMNAGTRPGADQAVADVTRASEAVTAANAQQAAAQEQATAVAEAYSVTLGAAARALALMGPASSAAVIGSNELGSAVLAARAEVTGLAEAYGVGFEIASRAVAEFGTANAQAAIGSNELGAIILRLKVEASSLALAEEQAATAATALTATQARAAIVAQEYGESLAIATHALELLGPAAQTAAIGSNELDEAIGKANLEVATLAAAQERSAAIATAYPHAQLEYDLCDSLGIVCWAENGHSNTSDVAGPRAEAITTEMVKQNYNHPSIAIWSVGNEAGAKVAEAMVPVVKALDSTRPVVVANMKCANADFRAQNAYPGWYQGHNASDGWKLKDKGYVSETGAGGVTTIHCDYAQARFKMNKYEPEEYQQLLCEALFQHGIAENDGSLGIFALWTTRDFTDHKYKGPIGWNTKGLLTYAGDKKDVYYLYRCFLRPDEPTIHIASKRYFIREGSVDNGIKVYSSAPHVTLTLNGEKVSTLDNGQYLHEGKRRVDHVFYWPVPLRTGRNDVSVSDDAGHSDAAVIYFYGAGGAPEVPAQNPLVDNLQTSNPANPAHFMDMPVQAQWPIYYDLDGSADNSFGELPGALQGARWIATRNVTKPGQESDLSFKVNRPVTVYVACTKSDQSPAYLTNAGFKEVEAPGFMWRDNKILLVPAQLYARSAAAGETIHLAQPDRDQIVMLKE